MCKILWLLLWLLGKTEKIKVLGKKLQGREKWKITQKTDQNSQYRTVIIRTQGYLLESIAPSLHFIPWTPCDYLGPP